jgi:hypothetical protein
MCEYLQYALATGLRATFTAAVARLAVRLLRSHTGTTRRRSLSRSGIPVIKLMDLLSYGTCTSRLDCNESDALALSESERHLNDRL